MASAEDGLWGDSQAHAGVPQQYAAREPFVKIAGEDTVTVFQRSLVTLTPNASFTQEGVTFLSPNVLPKDSRHLFYAPQLPDPVATPTPLIYSSGLATFEEALLINETSDMCLFDILSSVMAKLSDAQVLALPQHVELNKLARVAAQKLSNSNPRAKGLLTAHVTGRSSIQPIPRISGYLRIAEDSGLCSGSILGSPTSVDELLARLQRLTEFLDLLPDLKPQAALQPLSFPPTQDSEWNKYSRRDVERVQSIIGRDGILSDEDQQEVVALLGSKVGEEHGPLDKALFIPTYMRLLDFHPDSDKRAMIAFLNGKIDVSNIVKNLAALHGDRGLTFCTMEEASKGFRALHKLATISRTCPFEGLPCIIDVIQEAIVDVRGGVDWELLWDEILAPHVLALTTDYHAAMAMRSKRKISASTLSKKLSDRLGVIAMGWRTLGPVAARMARANPEQPVKRTQEEDTAERGKGGKGFAKFAFLGHLNAEAGLCRDAARGLCHRGANCRFSHENVPTSNYYSQATHMTPPYPAYAPPTVTNPFPAYYAPPAFPPALLPPPTFCPMPGAPMGLPSGTPQESAAGYPTGGKGGKGNKGGVCYAFPQGQCRLGDQCRFQHVLPGAFGSPVPGVAAAPAQRI